MGFDVKRFENLGDLEDELICSICFGVFEEPYVLTSCGHAFCKECIETWFNEKRSCPNDGVNVGYFRELVPAPIPFKNIIAKLRIHCDHQDRGCDEIVQVQELHDHSERCEFKPKPPVITAPFVLKRLFKNLVNYLLPVNRDNAEHQTNERPTFRQNAQDSPLLLILNQQLDAFGRRTQERPRRRIHRIDQLPDMALMQRYVVLFGFFAVIAVLLFLVISVLLMTFVDNLVSSFVLPCVVVFVTLFLITKFIENEPEQHQRPEQRRRILFD